MKVVSLLSLSSPVACSSSMHCLPRRFPLIRCFSTFSTLKLSNPARNPVVDWISANDGVARSLPIFTGGISLVAVLLNRAFSGIAPVADASSSQSRADILVLSLAVTNLLTGLVWLSIQPKYISPVSPDAIECRLINSSLPEAAVLELLWAWESLSTATCCRSFVVVYHEDCLLQIGSAARSVSGDVVTVDVPKLINGSLYRGVIKSEKQSYLANLSLYPGKTELPFFPANTQAVILQPLGGQGILIIGGDTIRGFTTSDQAWVTLIADKLNATLSS
ncbi:hypothetical protein HPP92_026426 [Vanilla planifolia]|uniref:Protein COFACTOR ASSEMBLY OF COMPLEX C SUBUNIT B CCB4, chloroplastic n=1 Tax=Vanilla planifolia TaxID=51239 RepID=A0A835PFX4_VANPL|nr:hypothetical protein HPP92_026426 [Vanilla planifolia]